MRHWIIPHLFALTCGCASDTRVVPIVGPDGSPMFHVSCGANEARCYQLAGERCPGGYDLGRTAAGRGNFLLRCRPPGSPPGNANSWVTELDLAPTPYGSTVQGPYNVPVPVTTVPPGYPPLGGGGPPAPKPTPGDVGY